jgi:hypothetical protein
LTAIWERARRTFPKMNGLTQEESCRKNMVKFNTWMHAWVYRVVLESCLLATDTLTGFVRAGKVYKTKNLVTNCLKETVRKSRRVHVSTAAVEKQYLCILSVCLYSYVPNTQSTHCNVFFHSVSWHLLTPCSCWPLVPKIAGSLPAEAVGFFGRKNPQRAFLRKGSKAVCPMSQICSMSKNPIIYRGSRKL